MHILSPDGRNTIVTRETQDGIVCGQAVHQREFGITKGMFWSPKGSALAFYRMDERMVTAYPLVNIDTRCATPVPHKYPMAGMKSHEVTVGVYQVATGQTVWLETGLPKEKYLTNIAWSPDEKSIYIAELNREQNEMHLVRYSALTGKKEADLLPRRIVVMWSRSIPCFSCRTIRISLSGRVRRMAITIYICMIRLERN